MRICSASVMLSARTASAIAMRAASGVACGGITGRERYVQFNREYPGDWHLQIERIVAEPGQVVTWGLFTVGLEEMYGISFFTGDESGRISAITDFWPEPYEPPAGREHLVERY